MHYNLKKLKGVYCVFIIVVLFLTLYSNSRRYNTNKKNIKAAVTTIPATESLKVFEKLEMKYILLWTNSKKIPFIYFREGTTIFKNRSCQFTNCYMTSNRSFLGNYSAFDVIAFNGPQLIDIIGIKDMPKVRSAHQKYVYVNIEAEHSYPICNKLWDRFFNWTWTYKLNSDAVWSYFAIRNSSNHVIGPSRKINWINENDMAPVDNGTILKLANKVNAAAWYVSNCGTIGKRENFFDKLQYHLTEYNLQVDVYGRCGELQCPKSIMSQCLKELQRGYYFYLVFENAISEDYVTEKILHALQHYTVPIVYGGSDYSRFLPPGSYLDAIELGPHLLAKKMYEIIKTPELYYNFFRWRKYYSFHFRYESPKTDEYCQLCALINNRALMNKYTVYNNFSSWWSPSFRCNRAMNFGTEQTVY